MISNEKLKEAITICGKNNYIVSMRDIAYAILCSHFEEPIVAYKCIFGNDVDYNQSYHDAYASTGASVFLKDMVNSGFFEEKKKKSKLQVEDISFEENKAYMLQLKRDTEKAIKEGEISKKDGYKILSDISTRLNDKFNVSENAQEQVIFVNSKFNAICECGREIKINK